LPAEEREVFELLWYHGLTQAEAARVLGTTERVVGSRWRRARLRLHRELGDRPPRL
jgi:RNA polymerase sigma-70 factor (ECF subfamily)